MKKFLLTLLFLLTFLSIVCSDTLFWKPTSVEFTPVKYYVYMGTTEGEWDDIYDVGTNTSWTVIRPIPDVRYNIMVTAISVDGFQQSLVPNDIGYNVTVTNSPYSPPSKVTGLQIVNVVKVN